VRCGWCWQWRGVPDRLPAAGLVTVAVIVGGCAPGDMGDLKTYIQKTKAERHGQIEAIPEMEPYEAFEYPDHARDPFDADVVETGPEQAPAGKRREELIDPDRPREYLEGFPLDSLRMVGTLERGGTQWALIKTPEQTIQRVKEGNYIGQNHGRITEITESKIYLTEVVPDGLGGWERKENSIALSD